MPKIPRVHLHKTGQYFVHLHGRDYYLGTNKAQADIDGARMVADYLSGRKEVASHRKIAGPNAPITIGELIARHYVPYLRAFYPEKDGRPAAQYSIIKAALDRLLAEHLMLPAASFDGGLLETLQHTMAASGNLSRKTVNRYSSSIKRFFKWAANKKFVPNDVYWNLTTTPGLRFGQTKAPERPRVKPVPDAVYKKTVPFLPKVVANMARLQYYTGMRPSEVCLLRPCDIDMTDPHVWRYVPAAHKLMHLEDAYRIIPIGRRGQKILSRYLKRSPTEYCFSPREEGETQRTRRKRRATRDDGQSTNLLSHFTRDRFDTRSYRLVIHQTCMIADVPKWSPNQLRHCHATRVRDKFGLEASSAALGHKNLKTTEIYAEKSWNAARTIAEKLG
ncbi:MAG: tyrosine-type recombinase/integrase [Pirellulaceae bacterium]